MQGLTDTVTALLAGITSIFSTIYADGEGSNVMLTAVGLLPIVGGIIGRSASIARKGRG